MRRDRVAIMIRVDGSLEYVGSRAAAVLAGMGTRVTARRRASHVVPVSLPLRLLFRAIRAVVLDESRLAGWTRRWRCAWEVRVVGGPRKGPFGSREAAIAWEVDYLESRPVSVT